MEDKDNSRLLDRMLFQNASEITIERTLGMPVTMETKPISVKPAVASDARAAVDECVRRRLGDCPYGFYFNKVSWQFAAGQLRLEGCVPTFYLKQMLQTILRDIEHVDQIVNDVDVISATGLSSCRPK
jgi:hypothetical protein